MQTTITPEFTIHVQAPFSSVQVIGSIVIARCVPVTMLSSSMSIWISEADDTEEPETPSAHLSRIIDGYGDIMDRHELLIAGLAGEYVKQRDRLVDKDDGIDVSWYRLRTMFYLEGKGTILSATAMCSEGELEVIEKAFIQTLASIQFHSSFKSLQPVSEQSTESSVPNDDPWEQLLHTAMESMEQIDQMEPSSDVREEISPLKKLENAQHIHVEELFQHALTQTGLQKHSDELRAIAQSAFTLIEAGSAPAELCAITRIGGGPDLPEGVAWPRNEDGLHYNFLAQINLSDLPESIEYLPSSGCLTFMSDTDLRGGKVLYWPESSHYIHHPLPEDAEDLANSVMQMLIWSSEHNRLVVSQDQLHHLKAHTVADGTLSFERFGQPVLALASEYEISLEPQTMRILPLLTLPDSSSAYSSIGLLDPFPVISTFRECMHIGHGPQHQLLGHHRSTAPATARAVSHAQQQGWQELTCHEDWFVLLALQSGGKAGFQFDDYGEFIYLANVKDTCHGNFSRVFTYLELE
ncbi:DUF1963 domain-containing protein [Paenibacillus cucumis (ex Kampfer et al. 2016)]|uniref:DUF1963 domain-containing protein n=1 Tax=Paenibacillus cucumis (ex Kampfer et al. 2016) TaxID=1776858 RepID=A0ABS7KFY4_9BACL|nr:DUF1963 domain-containing protein [Paenibacillus cucumis (ex Kampfer et al. 2016)]MBY0203044.1 DUF1963 domain-containing protein [Paenibacillus cucumis (ex Kampfer et al. 2016)]